jgi:hypothetical protein
VLFDDYVMRQIKKIGELAAALAAGLSGRTYESAEAELDEAYRALLGMERALADRMSAESLARLLGDPDQTRALALLMKAHGDLCASRGELDAAARLFAKGLGLLAFAEDAELSGELEARLTSTR